MSRIGNHLELLGATEIGDGAAAPAQGSGSSGILSTILQAGGELVTKGSDLADQKQAADKSKANDEASLQAAISADVAAAQAIAQSMTSDAAVATAKANAPAAGPAPKSVTDAQAKAAADQAGMQVALAAQDSATAALANPNDPKRLAAIAKATAAATKQLQGAPTSTYQQMLVQAWGKVMTKIQNAQLKAAAAAAPPPAPTPPADGSAPDDKGKGGKGAPMSTGKKVGIAAGAVAGAVGLGLLAKKFLF